MLDLVTIKKGTKSMLPTIVDALMELFKDSIIPDRKLKIFEARKK